MLYDRAQLFVWRVLDHSTSVVPLSAATTATTTVATTAYPTATITTTAIATSTCSTTRLQQPSIPSPTVTRSHMHQPVHHAGAKLRL